MLQVFLSFTDARQNGRRQGVSHQLVYRLLGIYRPLYVFRELLLLLEAFIFTSASHFIAVLFLYRPIQSNVYVRSMQYTESP